MVLVLDAQDDYYFLYLVDKIKSKIGCKFKKLAFIETLTKEKDKEIFIRNQLAVIKSIPELIVIQCFFENKEKLGKVLDILKKKKFKIIEGNITSY